MDELELVRKERPAKEIVANATVARWNMTGRLPDVLDIAKDLDTNPAHIQYWFSDEKFRAIVVIRGVPLSKNYQLSEEQFLAVAVVTDPTRKGNLRARLKETGIPWQTWNSWMKNPNFRDLYTKFAQDILESSLADVHMGLSDAASRGDVQAIKFYMELTGRWDPNAKQTRDVMAVLGGVVEVLQKEISDQDTLERVASGIEKVMKIAGLR